MNIIYYLYQHIPKFFRFFSPVFHGKNHQGSCLAGRHAMPHVAQPGMWKRLWDVGRSYYVAIMLLSCCYDVAMMLL